MIDWTDERMDFVRVHWLNGFSGLKIAKLFAKRYGFEVSRNAVIGKINRMGLMKARGKPPLKQEQVERIMTAPKAETKRKQERGGIPLLDAKDGQCRWPIERAGHYVCGQPVASGHSYCQGHCDVALYKQKRVRNDTQGGYQARRGKLSEDDWF